MMISMRQPLVRRPMQARQPRNSVAMEATPVDTQITERSVTFSAGDLFYKPKSRLIRDLGVLALSVMHADRQEPLRVLDAMSGSGVRSLRYVLESGGDTHVTSNELQFGEHPLSRNLAQIVSQGSCTVSNEDALNLYLRARLNNERFDLVDCDAFGTGMPHTAEAWWAVARGGLLYLCATDSCTTDGHNPHKSTSGYAAVAKRFPASNEQGLRLLLGAAWREAAARNLHARPVFSYFHAPSSSFRVMLQLQKTKRPPAAAYENLAHVARCTRCGAISAVPSEQLGSVFETTECACGGLGTSSRKDGDGRIQIMGPMWVGPMHDRDYVARMVTAAEDRGWDDAVALLSKMTQEAEAEKGGAFLYYNLGEVQRLLAARGLELPSLDELKKRLHESGFSASGSHIERKAIKTSATLQQVVQVVQQCADAM